MRMLFKAWQDWLAEQTYYVYDQGLAHISDLHQAKQVGNMRWKPVLHATLCCFYDVVARGRNKPFLVQKGGGGSFLLSATVGKQLGK